MFPKFMEGIAMLRAGLKTIPYRCCACAREVLVKVPVPPREDKMFTLEEYRPSLDRRGNCQFCGDLLGPKKSGHQIYHLECALAKNREKAVERANERPSGRRRYVGWPEAKIQLLVKLWEDGVDSMDIANYLRLTCRKSVYGYVHYFRKAGYTLPLRGKSHKRQPGGWTNAGPPTP